MSLCLDPEEVKVPSFIKEGSIESSSPADLSRAEEEKSDYEDDKELPSVPPENEDL